MTVRFNMIAAAAQNMGIGKENALPWTLPNEMAYFKRMTCSTKNSEKKNAVIMGRKTWDSVPKKFRPFSNRVNVIMTNSIESLKSQVPEGVYVVNSLDSALKAINERSDIENIWVIGGEAIYKLGVKHPSCHKIYLTEIKNDFDCDVFFPEIPSEFKLLSDHSNEPHHVPVEKQIEKSIEYYFRIYEKST